VLSSITAAGAQLEDIKSGMGAYKYDSYTVRINKMPAGVSPQDYLIMMESNSNGTINNN
jgi:hypothetical protein